MIRCLPEEVKAKLRSGVAISSLSQCIEELVLNSIDAKATCVAIRVDLEAFKVQVVDNGIGMGREDLNEVGSRYFTSKCHLVEDLENLKFYGFRGEAVASIASMASIVEISSKTSKTKTFMKMFQNGKALEVCEAELTRPSAGTTVTVCNLFHQLPVRRKCMDPILEFERVRQRVEALSLVHPSVSFSLRNDASCSMVLHLAKTKDMCSRFCQIHGRGRSQKLREINYKSGGFELSGYISSEGHYNKNLQFLYLNNRLVLKTRLHKLIDFLLRKESLICKTKSGPVSRQMCSSPVRHRCGPELYGIFIINMKCPYCEYDVCLEPAKTLIEFRSWDPLLTCIEEGVKAFLKQENLFIELSGEDIKEFNEKNDFCLSNSTALQPALPEEKSTQDCFKKACEDIVDSYEMFTLQSKSAKRKVTIGKKSSDFIDSTNNAEETKEYQCLTNFEQDNTLSSKVESLLPSEEGTIHDFSKSNILDQKGFNSSQTASVNLMSPEDLSGQTRSQILEINSTAETPHCTESCGKDVKNQSDIAVHKSNPVFVIQGQDERVEDATEATDVPELLYGRALMGNCDTAKQGRRTGKGPNNAEGGMVVKHGPLKLCSTDLITHIMKNQPLHEPAKMNCSLDMLSRPGPVSAKDIFVNKIDFPVETPRFQAVSSQLNKECLRLPSRGICTADANKWLKNETFLGQKNKEVTSLTADSKGDCVVSHIGELLPVSPSEFSHNESIANSQRQRGDLLVRPRPQAYKKLSSFVQSGSLERFRRQFGKVRSAPPASIPEERNEFGLPVTLGSPADTSTSKNQNNYLEHCSVCETPTAELVDSNNGHDDCLLLLERSQLSCGEILSDRKASCVRESTLTLTDYSQIRGEALNCTQSLGSLASKLSRLRGNHKGSLSTEVVRHPCEQSQVDSSRRETNMWDLCQISHVLRESGPDSSGIMENTVNKSLLIDTDGEYVVSPSRNMALPGKKLFSEGTCKDVSVLEVSSKQTLKASELRSMTLTHSLEVFTDDSSAAHSKEKSLFHPDWLERFDISLGKTIYINKTTGLSTYKVPPAEEPQATCTKDITTMAVNVVLENGFQCRCHPFRSEVVLPFLPRPQEKRILASQDFRGRVNAERESLQSLLSEWDNPVFACCPEVAVDVSSSQAENLAVKIHNILYPYRFTKEMIHSMQVLHQVDNKFIACLINTRNDVNGETDGNLLVLVDQHAAHERIRLEQLVADSYEKHPEASGKKKLLSSTVSPPLSCHKSLKDLGLEISFPENNRSEILVGKVPLCFVEREANELRRGRQPVAKSIVELLQTTGGARGTLPLTFLKVLASQACHGAIKFNDSLTVEESCQLIEALSCCQLPFQCAHGRPSMLPLADTDHLPQQSQPKPNLAKLRRMARAWQLFGEKKLKTESERQKQEC
uniref:MutL homolog 3 n=1 Tax=Sphenodon punctatus TaxID=8508 RepID=A0A8D0L9R5_SPHPU